MLQLFYADCLCKIAKRITIEGKFKFQLYVYIYLFILNDFMQYREIFSITNPVGYISPLKKPMLEDFTAKQNFRASIDLVEEQKKGLKWKTRMKFVMKT